MVRIILLIVGLFILLMQYYVQPFSTNTQFLFFLGGIILLGVPHGAADLLVANRNAGFQKKSFSQIRFFAIYLGRLFLFAAILWFFPLAGNLLFILFAAYHFGETDLHKFKTDTIWGKLFVTSYGLLILSVILLHHFEEVKPIYFLFKSGQEYTAIINQIDQNRYVLMSATGMLFFVSTFFYFLKVDNTSLQDKGQFLIRFTCILFLLYNMPMVIGFTFYFILWHSILSLINIIGYLRKGDANKSSLIIKQIVFYSLLAMVGIALFGLVGFMFINKNAIMGYVFLGLAVLTAPHMQVMHDMYNRLRINHS